MFFVFGTARSGTTLLAQCLDAHAEIVVPHETDFIIPMAFVLDRVPDPALGRRLVADLIVGSQGFTRSLGEYLDEQAVRDIVTSSEYDAAALIEALYARVADAAGARIAGDKSPNDLNFLRMLAKTGGLGGETRVIHLVRDIRDVMVSVNGTGWDDALDAWFPRQWCSQNLYLRALFSREPDRYHFMRYEDMVRAPEQQIARAAEFLGATFDPGCLAPARRSDRYREDAHHARLFEPITALRIGVHRSVIPRETLAGYETQAREALEAFGYLAP